MQRPGHTGRKALAKKKDQSTLDAFEPGILMTRACSLAAMGKKYPAHQQDPHPGYVNAMKLFMMAFTTSPGCSLRQNDPHPSMPRPYWCDSSALRVGTGGHCRGACHWAQCRIIWSNGAGLCSFSQTRGSTKVTAIAMPESLLTRRYRRQVKLVHVEKDELCVWHPRRDDVLNLEQNGIQVVYIEGAIHWLGGKKHNYGHLTVAELPTGTHDIYSLLNNEGVLPRDERHKAAMRLMSWCTFRMPSPLRNLLAALSLACAHPEQKTWTWCQLHHNVGPLPPRLAS